MCIRLLSFVGLAMLLGVSAKGGDAITNSSTELSEEPSRAVLFREYVAKPIRDQEERDAAAGKLSSFALKRVFKFPHDAIHDDIQNTDRHGVIFGIDTSHYTKKTIALGVLRDSKVDFVYTKATQGVNYTDNSFEFFWKGIANLPAEKRPLRGAYHFLSSQDDPEAQAKHFANYVQRYGGIKKDDLAPCLDLEWDVTKPNQPDRWAGQSGEKILEKVLVWLRTTEKLTGRKPVVYTALSWWKDRRIDLKEIKQLKDYSIWVADYSTAHLGTEKPATFTDRTQDLWQFSEKARLNVGYDDDLDANIFYGSRDKLEQIFGVTR